MRVIQTSCATGEAIATATDDAFEALRAATDRQLRMGLATRSIARAALAEAQTWALHTPPEDLRRMISDAMALVYSVMDEALIGRVGQPVYDDGEPF